MRKTTQIPKNHSRGDVRPRTRARSASPRSRRDRARPQATAAKQELLRQQSERGERGAATKDRGVITTKAPSKNAIADSIARKGGNSYYFAHGEQGLSLIHI